MPPWCIWEKGRHIEGITRVYLRVSGRLYTRVYLRVSGRLIYQGIPQGGICSLYRYNSGWCICGYTSGCIRVYMRVYLRVYTGVTYLGIPRGVQGVTYPGIPQAPSFPFHCWSVIPARVLFPVSLLVNIPRSCSLLYSRFTVGR